MFKDKKNFLNNILFVSIILLMILELIENFEWIGYFSEVTRILSIVAIPIMMILFGILIRDRKENISELFKKGFLIYFILQIIHMLIYAIFKRENPGYFMFNPYYIGWIFIAVPIYTLIMDKLGRENHILFTTTIIALCLTIDGSINSDLVCKLIMYLPFFVLGWKYEKETELIPKGKIATIGKIIILGFILYVFNMIDTENIIISSVKTTENAVQITTLKLMLYAISSITFSVIIDLFMNVKLFNKKYNFNIINVLILGPIINNILLQTKYTTLINSTYSSIILILTGVVITYILAYIKFYEIIDRIIDKIKIKKDTRKVKKKEKLIKKGKYEPKRLITPPDGILTKLVNSNILIIILGISIFLKAIMFYKNTVYASSVIPEHELWYNASFVLMFLVPLLLINNNKIRYVCILILDLFISIIFFADELYYSYSSMVISVNQAGNIRYIKEILDTVKYLLNIRQILYFIDIVIFIVLLKFIKYKDIKKGSKDRGYKNILVSLLIIYMCIGNIVTLCVFVYNAPYNNNYQISEGTIFGYHINDLNMYFNINGSLKYKSKSEVEDAYEELNKYYKENYTEKYKGIAKGKNVIVLQLESIQEFLYNAKINGKAITPNMNKFLDENIHITNMQSQSYTSTADSEFSVQTSLYPLENGLSFSKYWNAQYEDLFSIMTNNNYHTVYMHGNEGSFWNREKVYNNFDIDEIDFIDHFEDKSEYIMGYLSDELLYKQAISDIKKYKKPFFMNILSASSHTGFTLDGLSEEKREKMVTIDVGDYKGTVIGNYLESANYADYQFGMFINELKKNKIYDDTVILIFGDHYGVRQDEWSLYDYLSKECNIELNDIQKKINFTNVLAGIHIPGVKSSIISKPVSKLDIKPTIISILGIKADESDITLGMSIFSNKQYASTNEYTIITKDMYFDSKKWYYIKSGQEVDIETLEDKEKEKLVQYINNLEIELGISNSVPILYKIDGKNQEEKDDNYDNVIENTATVSK